MARKVDPLSYAPIAEKDGKATPFFARQWENLLRATGLLGELEADQKTLTQRVVANENAIDDISAREVIAGDELGGGGALGGPGDIEIDHAVSGVAPGTYGDATNVPQIQVNAFGHVESVTNVPISGGGGGSADYLGVPRFRGNLGQAFGASNFGCRSIFFEQACTIYAVACFIQAAQVTAEIIPGVYAITATGTIGALLAEGPEVTGLTYGLNILPLTTPLAVAAGAVLWVGAQLTVINTAFAQVDGRDTAFFAASGATLPNPAPAATYGSGTSMCFFAKITP